MRNYTGEFCAFQQTAARPRRELGLGLLHWEAHMQALAAITLFQYAGPGEPLYKAVLDMWFRRTTEGRGAAISTLPIRHMLRPLGQRADASADACSPARQCVRRTRLPLHAGQLAHLCAFILRGVWRISRAAHAAG